MVMLANVEIMCPTHMTFQKVNKNTEQIEVFLPF